MRLSMVVAAALSACALIVAGCGDDDDDDGGDGATTSTQQQSAGPQTFGEPLPQKTAKPNIVGGDAPIAQFGPNVFNEVVSYWTQLAAASNIQYAPPTAQFVSQTTPGCNGEPYDPNQFPASLCVNPQEGAQIWYSVSVLERFRASAGDAGAAFFIGWLPAVDVNNLVSGTNAIAEGNVTEAFLNRSACFEGSWIHYLNERRLLEAGDAEEIQKAVAEAVPGASSAEIKVAAVKTGYDKGAGECQRAYPD